MAFVLSTKAHAKILSVDTTEALAVPGVESYVDHTDIPPGGSNLYGVAVAVDEEVFATAKVGLNGDCFFA